MLNIAILYVEETTNKQVEAVLYYPFPLAQN